MPDKVNHADPDTALLRELLNRRPVGPDPISAHDNPDLPPVPHPSGFRPDPLVIGSQRLGQAVNKMHQIAPELRGRVGIISTAPTPGLLHKLGEAGIDPQYSDRTNNAGLFSAKAPDFGINQSELWMRTDDEYPDDFSLERVLGHEMGHIGNQRYHGFDPPRDTDMKLIEMLSERVLRPKR